MACDGTGRTFSEVHGYDQLPETLKLEDVPETARVQIWNVMYRHVGLGDQELMLSVMGITSPWKEIFQTVHDRILGRPLDDLELVSPSNFARQYRQIIRELPFNKLFDALQVIMRHPRCPREFVQDISDCFRRNRLAYSVSVAPIPTVFPAVTPEQAEATKRSLVDLYAAGLTPASNHLQKAIACINGGDFAGCVRESIHAVESVARRLDPNASKSLGPALKSLRKRAGLHPALESAFSKLYGYSSDEEGVRHSLVLKEMPLVDLEEALFMFGACASFCSYLWQKHQAGNGDANKAVD